MSFQDYKLPAQVVIDMYRSTLVLDSVPPTKKVVEASPVIPGIVFKGNNTRSIAVIVACRQKMSESSAEIVFLLKILKACNLGLDDIALIDCKSLSMEIEAFISDFKPERVLIFSKTFNGTALPPEICFEVKKSGSSDVLYAPEVHDMQADGNEAIQLKKKLWLVLKNFFNV